VPRKVCKSVEREVPRENASPKCEMNSVEECRDETR